MIYGGTLQSNQEKWYQCEDLYNQMAWTSITYPAVVTCMHYKYPLAIENENII